MQLIYNANDRFKQSDILNFNGFNGDHLCLGSTDQLMPLLTLAINVVPLFKELNPLKNHSFSSLTPNMTPLQAVPGLKISVIHMQRSVTGVRKCSGLMKVKL